jgi:hypothetical protein
MSARQHIDGLFEWGPRDEIARPGHAEYAGSSNVASIAAAIFGPAQEQFLNAITAKLTELGAVNVEIDAMNGWRFEYAGLPCHVSLSGNQRSVVINQPDVPGSYCVDLAVALKKIAKTTRPPRQARPQPARPGKHVWPPE